MFWSAIGAPWANSLIRRTDKVLCECSFAPKNHFECCTVVVRVPCHSVVTMNWMMHNGTGAETQKLNRRTNPSNKVISRKNWFSPREDAKFRTFLGDKPNIFLTIRIIPSNPYSQCLLRFCRNWSGIVAIFRPTISLWSFHLRFE